MGIIRSRIESANRRTQSKRAQKEKIEILRDRKCPHCHHHKFIMSATGFCKCAKCKKQIKI